MDTTTVIGILGATGVLIAFVKNQLHQWRDTSLRYDLLNLIGSVLLVVYAYLLASWPFLILNAVWATVSLRDVITGIRKKGKYSH